MHPKLFLALFAFFATTFAMTGFAADANFQANCSYIDPDSFVCEFDAQRTPMGQAATSCDPATPERYFWRFGDGSSAVTTTPETDHLYDLANGGPSFFPPGVYEVCLSVGCSDDTTAYRCHCADFFNQTNLPDCIQAGGWSPR